MLTASAAVSAAASLLPRRVLLREGRKRLRPVRSVGRWEFTTTSSSVACGATESEASSQKDSHRQSGLFRLLTDDQRHLLEEQRSIVERVQQVASQVGDGVEVKHCQGGIGAFLSSQNRDGTIDSTFLIVVAGEFNAGKSTLINALLGEKILETGALPTTDTVHVLAYDGNNSEAGASNSAGRDPTGSFMFLENKLLNDLTLIDTPGTNAVHADHRKITEKLLPAADLILFVTSADRPFPESERLLLQSIQSYRKNVVIVLNKLDTLDASGGNHGMKEKERMISFVTEHASELLGARPVVLAVSARDALGSKVIGGGKGLESNAVWKRSNFSELESFLTATLTDKVKIRSKILNPLGVAEGMLDDCLESLAIQRKELETDLATMRLFEGQMKGWSTEIEEEMTKFREEVSKLMHAEGDRCQEVIKRMSYLDQWKWTVLGNASEYQNTWSRSIREATETELISLVHDVSDNIAIQAKSQGEAVTEYLGKRPASLSRSLIGNVTTISRFDDISKEMTEKMSDKIDTILSSHDSEKECMSALQSLRGTAQLSGTLFAGGLVDGVVTALGNLDLVAGMSSSAAFFIAGVSTLVIGNKSVASSHQKRWKDSSIRLDQSLKKCCFKGTDRVKSRILNGVSPYTRYVNNEKVRTEKLSNESEVLVNEALSLRNKITKLTH